MYLLHVTVLHLLVLAALALPKAEEVKGNTDIKVISPGAGASTNAKTETKGEGICAICSDPLFLEKLGVGIQAEKEKRSFDTMADELEIKNKKIVKRGLTEIFNPDFNLDHEISLTSSCSDSSDGYKHHGGHCNCGCYYSHGGNCAHNHHGYCRCHKCHGGHGDHKSQHGLNCKCLKKHLKHWPKTTFTTPSS